jgi:hypothetical protein
MKVVKVILLAPLIAVYFAVLIPAFLLAVPVGFALKRLFGWDPHETPDHQGNLEVVYCSGFVVLLTYVTLVIWFVFAW